jgi:hypothetical protein
MLSSRNGKASETYPQRLRMRHRQPRWLVHVPFLSLWVEISSKKSARPEAFSKKPTGGTGKAAEARVTTKAGESS